MRHRHPLLALLVVLLMLLAGCGGDDEQATDGTDKPGLAEAAELNVADADRIEVREGGRAWPSNGRPESWNVAEVVAELTDPDEVAALTDALGQARYITPATSPSNWSHPTTRSASSETTNSSNDSATTRTSPPGENTGSTVDGSTTSYTWKLWMRGREK